MRFRTHSLLLLFIFPRPLGNLSLAWGTKHFPEVLSLNPVVYLRAMVDPFVALGVATPIGYVPATLGTVPIFMGTGLVGATAPNTTVLAKELQ